MKCSVRLAILLEITANLYHRDAHLRLHEKDKFAGSKAYRRQQGRAQGEKERQRWLRIQRASKVCGKRSLSIQRKEAVEAVAPALARGWLRQRLGRSTG